MNKQSFLLHRHVQSFIAWLVSNGDHLKIDLIIKASSFVSRPIKHQCIGIPSVLQHYQWRSNNMHTGDWAECVQVLNDYSTNLRIAVSAHDHPAVIDTCMEIFEWGGERNPGVGGRPFLMKLKSPSEYLIKTAQNFQLSTASLDALPGDVGLMNSMLTKVHALYSDDGLPIYDSRVAVAIATLVELWRRSQGPYKQLPEILRFPATYPDRQVVDVFSDAPSHGVLSVKTKNSRLKEWTQSIVRLGWIMEEVLARTNWFKGSEDDPTSQRDRMHALEACLFMIGYDIRCMSKAI